MTSFDAYDPSEDLLNVLRADRAGRRLAARLRLIGTEEASRDASTSDPPGLPSPFEEGFPGLWGAVLDSMVRSGLKARLLHGGGVFTTADPDGLQQVLEASPRFRRDTRLGSLFHHPKISFREVAPTDSLHVVIDGNTVSSHIDRVSPLNCDPDGQAHYSPVRVLAHNVTGMLDDVVRYLRSPRRHGSGSRESPGSIDDAGAPSPPAGSSAPAVSLLPFSVIDEAVHLLETEAAPWSIQLELRVAGALDEPRLRAAVLVALGRHSMARVRKKASRRTLHLDHWEVPASVDVDPLRVVDCPDDEALERARAELHSLAVPLAESPPLRVRLVHHDEGDLLMLNVNHAAMDGFGVLRVLRSIARAYAADADPIPVDVDMAGTRDLSRRLSAPNPGTRLRRHLVLIEKSRDLIAPPARVAPDAATGGTGYGFHHLALSTASTQALIGHGHRGTVNDVLIAALHGTIARWNAEHGVACRRIAVLVPANLRPPEHRHDLVGNFSLPARVTTTRRSRRDPWATLAAVTAQTSRKKKTGMGTALIEVLGPSRQFPLWAKQAMVALLPVMGDRMVDTAMLSNLGVLDDVPSFGPEAGAVTEVWFSPPARMPLGVTIGAVTVSGRLHLSFRYRNRQFGPAAAHRFAQLYVDQLGHTVGALTVPLRPPSSF